MNEETEYVNAKTLINLVANSDFSTTSGWSCNVYSENLSNTTSMDGFVSTDFKGKVEAGGAKVIYDNFITSAVTESDYSFPTESPQYLTYTSPKTTQNY
jgi:methyltransferase-like protein